MAKLTRVQRASIERALYHATRAQRFISEPRIVVATRSHGTTTLDYIRASDGRAVQEIAKELGSDLVGLPDAIRELERLLVD